MSCWGPFIDYVIQRRGGGKSGALHYCLVSEARQKKEGVKKCLKMVSRNLEMVPYELMGKSTELNT